MIPSKVMAKMATLGFSEEQAIAVADMMREVEAATSVDAEMAIERRREADRARQQRRRGAMDVSESDWYSLRSTVFERDGRVCAYCGDTSGPHHIDHVIPLARGGKSEPGNLKVACYACNASKRDKTLEEWGGR